MPDLSIHTENDAAAWRERRDYITRAQIRLIGAASGRGAKDTRCADGPDSLQDNHLARTLRSDGIQANWQAMLHADHKNLSSLHAVADMAARLADIVEKEAKQRHFFAVLGGDHTCAIGAWSGAARALRQTGPLGLIWLDAHMDSHTPETSPSGALHGMPLACLLGYGPGALTTLAEGQAAIFPGHVCLIGVRSFEPEEAALLDGLRVRVYHMAEISKRGLDAVMHEAVERTGLKTAGFGISIDLDGIDPVDAPAVGSPAPGGIRRRELLAALPWLASRKGLIGAEIAEFNPGLDRKKKTARLIAEILAALTPGAKQT